MGKDKQGPAVPPALREVLRATPKAALAFSGGVDSAYLLYAARVCGVDVRAYTVHSQFQPQFEMNDAARLASELGADMAVIPLDVLAIKAIRANPANRCYHCKRAIFKAIAGRAATEGYHALMDGSNASDDAAQRPGMRALAELKVLSPLRAAGLAKDAVRALSREAGLFTWNKPAYACLATRVPAGTALLAETLRRVEQAEDALSGMGFSDFRVRVMGIAARLQLPAGQFARAAARHAELVQALAPWFSEVLLDLQPR